VTHEDRGQELGTNRIEALSDGIFAVAMTLLILEFQVPHLPHDAPNVVVAPALFALWPKFITYIISFLSLGVFWAGHHNMYHIVRRADRVLMWLNIVFFMFVACLPFSASVLNAFRQTQIAPLMFGANLTIIGWLLYLQWEYAGAQPGMLEEAVTPNFRAAVRTRFLAYPVIAGLTMLICFWSIPISLAIYLALLPLYMIPSQGAEEPAPSGEKKPARACNLLPGKGLIVGKSAEVSSSPVKEQRLVSKKIIIGICAAVVLIAGWAAFRPELLFVNKAAHDTFPATVSSASGTPVALAMGPFHGVAHQTKGDAGIFRLADGSRVLRLTNFSTSNGPDVRLYLIGANDATDNATVTHNFVEVAKLKANEGDQNYPLPASIDLSKYHAVTVWCNRFNVNFATAPPKPAQN
jgi:uncharacterized membrane protein